MKKFIKVICFGFGVMLALAVSVSTMAQSFYADLPSTSFRSTSGMDGSGSAYSSNPTLNENGTASSPDDSSPAGGPRRVGGLPGSGGSGSEEMPNNEDYGDNTPIGDAALPLLLMAVAFGGVIYLRRRKQAVVE